MDWSGFLRRAPLPQAGDEAVAMLRGQTVLVTGAGGSIGSALVERLSDLASRVVLLESSESRLFGIAPTPQGSRAERVPVLGSAGDPALLDEVFAEFRPAIVFHAAAYKHVPLMESQPLAAVGNNVFGTVSLAKAAGAHRARLVLLSTDKAVQPASVMGATKRVAERIVLRDGGTVLRLGNVLASSDSVAETFARCLEGGQALPVTDARSRRYFLTMREAVELLISAAGVSAAGPVLLAPQLQTEHSITELGRFLAEKLAPRSEPEFHVTRPRPGDKESEQLWGGSERLAGQAAPGLWRIDPAEEDDPREGLTALQDAWNERDVQAVISCLQRMAAGYAPSDTVRALTRRTSEVDL